MSGCQNPVTLCSILSSLSPSLSRTFRNVAFFFRGIHVSEIHFRELSRKTCDKSSPFSVVKCVLKPLIPSTTDIVLQQLSLWQHLDRYCIWWPPPPSPPRPPPHPQPRAPDLSGHCRTSARRQRVCQIELECKKECQIEPQINCQNICICKTLFARYIYICF